MAFLRLLILLLWSIRLFLKVTAPPVLLFFVLKGSSSLLAFKQSPLFDLFSLLMLLPAVSANSESLQQSKASSSNSSCYWRFWLFLRDSSLQISSYCTCIESTTDCKLLSPASEPILLEMTILELLLLMFTSVFLSIKNSFWLSFSWVSNLNRSLLGDGNFTSSSLAYLAQSCSRCGNSISKDQLSWSLALLLSKASGKPMLLT